MSDLSRSLQFLFLGVLLLGTHSLYAEGLPSPNPPRPATENAQLKGLKGLLAGSKDSRTQNDSIETTPPLAERERSLSEPLPSLPMPKTVTQASASFSTPRTNSANAMLSEINLLDQEPDDLFDDEYQEVPNAMLAKPLLSKKMARENGGDNDGEAVKEAEEQSGWTNKLVKPELTPVLSVGGSLLIVIAAFFLLAVLFRKVTPQGNRLLPKEAFECLGRYFLTQKHQLQVLRLGNRIVLVSVMPDKVSTLAEITDPDETVAFLGLCRRLDTNSATEMFRKTIANMSEDELSRPYNRPVVTSRRPGLSAGSLDLYSDPDESLASMLAKGRR